MNYQENYQDNLIGGQEYQDFVIDQLYENGIPVTNYSSKKYQLSKGENRAGIEIKYDRKFETTGNLWIELNEKSHPSKEDYVESGIYRNCWLYVIGNYREIFIFSQRMLMLIADKYKPIQNNTRTSIGFLLPRKDAEKYAAKIIKINKGGGDGKV